MGSGSLIPTIIESGAKCLAATRRGARYTNQRDGALPCGSRLTNARELNSVGITPGFLWQRVFRISCFLLPLALVGCTPRIINPKSCGAIGNGLADDTRAIQRAIDHCPKDGCVQLSAGTYISGALFLKSNITFALSAGATLKGTTNNAEYPSEQTRIAGIETTHPSCLMNATNCTHVSLAGRGTIDGSGQKWWDYFWKMRKERGRGVDFQVLRPRLVCFTRCSDCQISGLHLINSPFWNLHLLYSHNISVVGLTIREPSPHRAPSSDGIDVDSSHDVTISKCDIACDDDDISIKSGRDADGLRVNIPSENVTIRDCHFGTGGGVAMGSETAGGIRHVLVENCRFDGTGAAVRIKSMPGRGGTVEDITYRDISAKNVRSPIEINLAWGGDDWKKFVAPRFAARVPTELGTPHVRDIHIINLTARDCPTAGFIYGLSNSPVSDIHFDNVDIQATRGLDLRNVGSLDLNGLRIQTQSGPATLHSHSH